MHYISFDTGYNSFAHLLVGNDPLLFWIIDLSPGRKGSLCKAYPLEFITAERSDIFHHRITDQVPVLFFSIYDNIMCIKVETVFLWKISEVIDSNLATNRLT